METITSTPTPKFDARRVRPLKYSARDVQSPAEAKQQIPKQFHRWREPLLHRVRSIADHWPFLSTSDDSHLFCWPAQLGLVLSFSRGQTPKPVRAPLCTLPKYPPKLYRLRLSRHSRGVHHRLKARRHRRCEFFDASREKTATRLIQSHARGNRISRRCPYLSDQRQPWPTADSNPICPNCTSNFHTIKLICTEEHNALLGST